MAISVFDMFKIGIGPSSSHTVGPMRAARAFCLELEEQGLLARTAQVITQLYGSLALTGKGHATDKAVLLGLAGEEPDKVDPDAVESILKGIADEEAIELLGRHRIAFDYDMHLLFLKSEVLPRHSNGMRFTALDADGNTLHRQEYFSIGGGFIVRGDEPGDGASSDGRQVPYELSSGDELLEQCARHGLAIHELVMANEKTWRSGEEVRTKLLEIWQVMQDCVNRGVREEGILPGGLNVKRRAPKLYRELVGEAEHDHMDVMDWVNCFALAVNEENAAGGRVVTAPTNGAAGIIPAVLHYYMRFTDSPDEEGVIRFLLTAGAIGALYKKNAGISGAEMGCQGEVGVACSMAAGGLAAALGYNNDIVENAAEIGMEHNL